MLLQEKLIGLPLIEKILHWHHTGFSVHSKVRAQSKSEAERAGKYMIRPLLSLKRLLFDETEGKIRYQYSRHGLQEESMDYPEFIARVTSHIPDKGQVMIRYYGLYANAHRGKMRKAGAQPSHPPIIEDHKVIGRIIHHLELTFEAERPPPPHQVQQELLDGSRGRWRVYLRASAAVFCLFKDRVYLEPVDLRHRVNCAAFCVLTLAFWM
jgi:hypothetical protein